MTLLTEISLPVSESRTRSLSHVQDGSTESMVRLTSPLTESSYFLPPEEINFPRSEFFNEALLFKTYKIYGQFFMKPNFL